MRYPKFALLLAAALLAGSIQASFAAESAGPDDEDFAVEDYGWGPRRWRDGDYGRRRGEGRRSHRGYDEHRGPGFGPGHRFGGPGGPGHHDGFDFPGNRHFGPGGFGPGPWADLDLDDAQKAKLVDLMTENFKTGLEAKIKHREIANQLRELRDAEQPDAEAIIAANAALGEIRGRLEALRIKAREDFRSVLNPEQIKKLDERRERWNRDRDGRPFPPPPGEGKRPPKSRPGPGPRR